MTHLAATHVPLATSPPPPIGSNASFPSALARSEPRIDGDLFAAARRPPATSLLTSALSDAFSALTAHTFSSSDASSLPVSSSLARSAARSFRTVCMNHELAKASSARGGLEISGTPLGVVPLDPGSTPGGTEPDRDDRLFPGADFTPVPSPGKPGDGDAGSDRVRDGGAGDPTSNPFGYFHPPPDRRPIRPAVAARGPPPEPAPDAGPERRRGGPDAVERRRASDRPRVVEVVVGFEVG